jgi:predicted CXXCH cytochrome family protein
MKIRFSFAMLILFAAVSACAQISGDVLGAHDLSPSGGSSVKGSLSGACLYCHAPHSGLSSRSGAPSRALWNQQLSTAQYKGLYTSTTNQGTQPQLGGHSNLCLSCHDGTVAPGQTIAYGAASISNAMPSPWGTNLATAHVMDLASAGASTHPFSLALPIKDAPYLVASFAAERKTADPSGRVKLIDGNIECTTCHEPHAQSVDGSDQNFLVRTNSDDGLCTACHDMSRTTIDTPTTSALATTSAVKTMAVRTMTVQSTATRSSTLAVSHATASVRATPQHTCTACHNLHQGRTPDSLLAGKDEQACATCHAKTQTQAASASDVFSEFAKGGHPLPDSKNVHAAHEPALLNQNRHATCADCHDSHSAQPTTSFGAAPEIRSAQQGAVGISGDDGVTAKGAGAQYETCLRCHGSSTGKLADLRFGYLPVRTDLGGDPYDVRSQFALSALSAHPVMRDRASSLPQPSLLTRMMNLDGTTEGRLIGARIFCTDCHNSDDNREFGGTGANGPHGSKFSHILERRYEFTRAPAPGQQVTNLFPDPDLSSFGPYAMCAKCHDLKQVVADTSFAQHSRHIKAGFSCSTCHTAHGIGTQSAATSGERLLNFDLGVVAANGATPISYNRANSTCSLVCHGHAH